MRRPVRPRLLLLRPLTPLAAGPCGRPAPSGRERTQGPARAPRGSEHGPAGGSAVSDAHPVPTTPLASPPRVDCTSTLEMRWPGPGLARYSQLPSESTGAEPTLTGVPEVVL